MKKFTKAWDEINKCPVDVNDLPLTRNGLKSNCTCVECKQSLEACQGEKRAWYFRHQSQTNCKGGPMTALHLMAQFVLTGNQTITTREGEEKYRDGVTEFYLPDSKFKADVAGTKTDGSKFIIEILVTHEVNEPKIIFLKEQKIHSIEIDLSKLDPDISKGSLLNLLLTDVSMQRVIYSPNISSEPIIDSGESQPTQAKSSWFEDIVLFAIFVGVFVGASKFLKGLIKRGGNKYLRSGMQKKKPNKGSSEMEHSSQKNLTKKLLRARRDTKCKWSELNLACLCVAGIYT